VEKDGGELELKFIDRETIYSSQSMCLDVTNFGFQPLGVSISGVHLFQGVDHV